MGNSGVCRDRTDEEDRDHAWKSALIYKMVHIFAPLLTAIFIILVLFIIIFRSDTARYGLNHILYIMANTKCAMTKKQKTGLPRSYHLAF